ncbi:MAG TPA: lipopolysaccharide heptosyltransferase I [Ramlibacter sp.]
MRILIVKLSSLGDVVQTLPVVHDIHARFPGAVVDWVVEEAFAPLLRAAPTIARVLPMAQRRWRKARWAAAVRRERQEFLRVLRTESYDAVLDLQGLIKSALVARQARLAPGGFTASFGNRSELCGYEWPVRYLVQRPVPMPRRMHAVARTRWMAAAALGYDTAVADQPPVYPWARDPAPGAPQVVFAHGTTRADNEWPEAHWRALGARFAAEGFQVLLPQAGPREAQFAQRLATAIGPAAQVLPPMDLAKLLARMAQASGLVGVDSGIAHMGVALGLPVVEIFSQPRAWRAGPVGQRHQRSVGGEHVPEVEEVWTAWRACWDARVAEAVA